MIILDDTNIISNFADYLKYGLIGLSAIVLILTYFLLYKEQSRENEARENILTAIKKYMWTALFFLIISGTWSILEKYIQPSKVTEPYSSSKSFALDITIFPDSTLNSIESDDSLILKYREKKTELKWRIAPVEKGKGENLIAVLDSLKTDEIYQVQLFNVNKKIFWENDKEISVTCGSTSLFFKNR